MVFMLCQWDLHRNVLAVCPMRHTSEPQNSQLTKLADYKRSHLITLQSCKLRLTCLTKQVIVDLPSVGVAWVGSLKSDIVSTVTMRRDSKVTSCVTLIAVLCYLRGQGHQIGC